MDHNTGVYQLINLINDKRYIGSSINLKERKSSHFRELKKQNHRNKYFQRAYNKYGIDNLKFEILLYCSKEDLIFYEQRAIDAYDFKILYNVKKKADSNQGLKLSEEHKRKISESNKGRTPSAETRLKMSESQKRKPPISEETKRKLSIAGMNRVFSEETKIKLSNSSKGRISSFKDKKHSDKAKEILSKKHKGKKMSKEAILKMVKSHEKPIRAFIYKENIFVGDFTSVKNCSEKLNINKGNISSVLSGKRKSCSGYTFEYIKNRSYLICFSQKVNLLTFIVKVRA